MLIGAIGAHYEDRATLVSLGDDLEQQVSAEFVDLEIPEPADFC